MKATECLAAVEKMFPDASVNQRRLMVSLFGQIRGGWDPEEEPLPECLDLVVDGDQHCAIHTGEVAGNVLCFVNNYGGGIPRGMAVAAEAVRRYNLMPKLREVADAWEGRGDRATARRLRAILDGNAD